MNGGPSSFNNALVTKAFVIASALFTIFFRIQGRFNGLGLTYQDIFGKLCIWKLIMSVFAFLSTPELMFGLHLLCYFRVFERQISSNKYSRNYSALVQSASEPLEDSIAMLVSMGFGRNLARQALVQARNDVNVATNILLEAQSH